MNQLTCDFVKVIDANDNIPEFTESSFSFDVYESAAKGTQVCSCLIKWSKSHRFTIIINHPGWGSITLFIIIIINHPGGKGDRHRR